MDEHSKPVWSDWSGIEWCDAVEEVFGECWTNDVCWRSRAKGECWTFESEPATETRIFTKGYAKLLFWMIDMLETTVKWLEDYWIEDVERTYL